MNKIFWHKIKKDYPLAYEECREWVSNIFEDNIISIAECIVSLRDLYDFFDDRNIIIIIDLTCDEKSWSYQILQHMVSQSYHKSRPLAEKAAFKKAFEILNNQLKNK